MFLGKKFVEEGYLFVLDLKKKEFWYQDPEKKDPCLIFIMRQGSFCGDGTGIS